MKQTPIRQRKGNTRQQSATMQFTRCELTHQLKSCEFSRGHVFAKSLDGKGNFFTEQVKEGRVRHECVFCGMTGNVKNDDTGKFERCNDGVVVTDVINSDTVRSEAEIRNISVSHFKVGQENE